MGDIQGAFRLKDEMEAIGVSSWDVAESAMVRGLAQCGKVEEAMLVLDCMLQKRLIPTVATFTTLMHMLCKKAKLSEALKLRGKMALYGVKLDVVAYNVLISGLCADGDALAAFNLYEEMKERGLWPNTTTYCTLIDAISTNEVSLVKSGILLKDLQERGMISWNFNGSTDEGLITAMKNLKSLRHNRRT
jgi:leucine-rich PPR motif-containing protein